MNDQHSTLLLASASPRRRELLAGLGLTFEVLAADVDETLRHGEPPDAAVLRLAADKAETGARHRTDAVVLGADTLVTLAGRIFGKPRDAAQAGAMLRELSGRTHRVWTGVAVARAGSPTVRRAAVAEVTFKELSAAEIAAYLDTGEPLDKAGAYAIQGRASAFVTELRGELSTVIGLPMSVARELLQGAGVVLG